MQFCGCMSTHQQDLFNLCLYVHSVTLAVPASNVSVAFRFHEYPCIVIKSPSTRGSVLKFTKGKSCLFKADPATLSNQLRLGGIGVYVADMSDSNRARLIGATSVRLAPQILLEKAPHVPVGEIQTVVNDKGFYDVKDSMGNVTGAVELLVRLTRQACDLVKHFEIGDGNRGPILGQCHMARPPISHDTPQPPMTSESEREVVVERDRPRLKVEKTDVAVVTSPTTGFQPQEYLFPAQSQVSEKPQRTGTPSYTNCDRPPALFFTRHATGPQSRVLSLPDPETTGGYIRTQNDSALFREVLEKLTRELGYLRRKEIVENKLQHLDHILPDNDDNSSYIDNSIEIASKKRGEQKGAKHRKSRQKSGPAPRTRRTPRMFKEIPLTHAMKLRGAEAYLKAGIPVPDAFASVLPELEKNYTPGVERNKRRAKMGNLSFVSQPSNVRDRDRELESSSMATLALDAEESGFDDKDKSGKPLMHNRQERPLTIERAVDDPSRKKKNMRHPAESGTAQENRTANGGIGQWKREVALASEGPSGDTFSGVEGHTVSTINQKTGSTLPSSTLLPGVITPFPSSGPGDARQEPNCYWCQQACVQTQLPVNSYPSVPPVVPMCGNVVSPPYPCVSAAPPPRYAWGEYGVPVILPIQPQEYRRRTSRRCPPDACYVSASGEWTLSESLQEYEGVTPRRHRQRAYNGNRGRREYVSEHGCQKFRSARYRTRQHRHVRRHDSGSSISTTDSDSYFTDDGSRSYSHHRKRHSRGGRGSSGDRKKRHSTSTTPRRSRGPHSKANQSEDLRDRSRRAGSASSVCNSRHDGAEDYWERKEEITGARNRSEVRGANRKEDPSQAKAHEAKSDRASAITTNKQMEAVATTNECGGEYTTDFDTEGVTPRPSGVGVEVAPDGSISLTSVSFSQSLSHSGHHSHRRHRYLSHQNPTPPTEPPAGPSRGNTPTPAQGSQERSTSPFSHRHVARQTPTPPPVVPEDIRETGRPVAEEAEEAASISTVSSIRSGIAEDSDLPGNNDIGIIREQTSSVRKGPKKPAADGDEDEIVDLCEVGLDASAERHLAETARIAAQAAASAEELTARINTTTERVSAGGEDYSSFHTSESHSVSSLSRRGSALSPPHTPLSSLSPRSTEAGATKPSALPSTPRSVEASSHAEYGLRAKSPMTEEDGTTLDSGWDPHGSQSQSASMTFRQSGDGLDSFSDSGGGLHMSREKDVGASTTFNQTDFTETDIGASTRTDPTMDEIDDMLEALTSSDESEISDDEDDSPQTPRKKASTTTKQKQKKKPQFKNRSSFSSNMMFAASSSEPSASYGRGRMPGPGPVGSGYGGMFGRGLGAGRSFYG